LLQHRDQGFEAVREPSGTDRGDDLKFTKEVSAFDSDARAGLDFMAQHECCTGRLGVMGICLGGDLAFRAAMNRDVLAAVCFYATDIHDHQLGKRNADDSLARAGDIKGERLGSAGPACPTPRPHHARAADLVGAFET